MKVTNPPFEQDRQVLVVLSGPSGVGKGRVCNALLQQQALPWAVAVSTTTRLPRPGEQEGQHYFFVDTNTFKAQIEEGAFLEWAIYNDNYYGTSWQALNRLQAQGNYVLLEIDVQGALQVRQHQPDSLLVFIAPPSLEELERRLRERGSEEEAVIQQRLACGRGELKQQQQFDLVLVNHDVALCAQQLETWVQAQLLKNS